MAGSWRECSDETAGAHRGCSPSARPIVARAVAASVGSRRQRMASVCSSCSWLAGWLASLAPAVQASCTVCKQKIAKANYHLYYQLGTRRHGSPSVHGASAPCGSQ
eukprot:3042074-Prymnesium_polylepis.1